MYLLLNSIAKSDFWSLCDLLIPNEKLNDGNIPKVADVHLLITSLTVKGNCGFGLLMFFANKNC